MKDKIIDFVRTQYAEVQMMAEPDALKFHFEKCRDWCGRSAEPTAARAALVTMRNHAILAFREIRLPEPEVFRLVDEIFGPLNLETAGVA